MKPQQTPQPLLSTDFENDFSYGTSVATSSPSVRLAFIRKVYGILASQLALTVTICALFMFVSPLRSFAINAAGLLMIVSVIGTFASLFALMAKKDSYPLNLQLLAAFTVSEAFLVGTVCARYAATGLSSLVLEALVITLAIFAGITLYAFTSKKDFSFMGGALYAALLALIACSFINLVLGVTGNKSPALAFAMSWGGSVLFSLYILYDSKFNHIQLFVPSMPAQSYAESDMTSRVSYPFCDLASLIMHHLGPDDAIFAAISLYLDILNLFLNILAILSRNRD